MTEGVEKNILSHAFFLAMFPCKLKGYSDA